MLSPVIDNLPQNPDPNVPQRLAANPDSDVWVSASAGSGKTKVLTDRVLRLLLPDPDKRWAGAKPHKILCITFTKAAAALMALRVQKKLAEWAMMPDADLREDLEKLLGKDPPPHVMEAAKCLFSEVLDVPGGLSIMTIHSFCQSILGRFPLEAGVMPGFQVMEEGRADETLNQIIIRTIRGLQQADHQFDQDFISCFNRLSVFKDIETLQEIVKKLLADIWNLEKFLNGETRYLGIRNKLLIHAGLPDNINLDGLWAQFQTYFPWDQARYLAQVMGKDRRVTDQRNGQKIADWLAKPISEQMRLFDDLLWSAFFTEKDQPRKMSVAAEDPVLSASADYIRKMMSDYIDRRALLIQIEQSADLLTLAAYCLNQYAERKRDLNSLDFTDLILKTRRLLEAQHLEWVHYKLDEGIDHILVDEAQDTNIHQWAIIEKLSAEYASGWSSLDNRPRSLFVVGDEKQSIFSFHGADPDAFKTMQEFFSERSKQAQRHFRPIRLETSFRTAPPLLKLVDEIFATPAMRRHIGLEPDQNLIHYSNRAGDAGHAECWPMLEQLQQGTDKDTAPTWVLPPVSNSDLQKGTLPRDGALASQIAMHIAGLVSGNDILVAENRPIQPRDILVLVRNRSGFVSDLVRHLKRLHIPVSGVDRMLLNDQIAVMDCLALARFARYPEDNLSLACILRSPYIRLTEDELMQLALNRSGSLWDAVQHSGRIDQIRWLQRVIARARLKKPFEFYDELLNEPSPREGFVSCWQAFLQDLGEDCRDPLEEFLGHCLNAESDGIYGLEEFTAGFQKRQIQIKRDIEGSDKDAQNQVRIMTVHASKGLEAPIVYLPDTIGYPDRRKLDDLQWITNSSNQCYPLWAASSKNMSSIYKTERDHAYDKAISEYHRLLYVALTRPRDRLYIMSEAPKRGEARDDCWYNVIRRGFTSLGAESGTLNGRLVLDSQQTRSVPETHVYKDIKNKIAYPDWLLTPPQSVDQGNIRMINPSRIDDGDDNISNEFVESGLTKSEYILSPLLNQDTHRFLRGNLTHRLFEILPDLPLQSRKEAAQAYLERAGQGLELSVRHSILYETLSILTDPVFAEVFGPNSRAEVPITGPIGKGQVINGQIDRLVITESRVLVVDFKTNRPSPTEPAAIPAMYRAQLRAYKMALQLIYPDKEIICALLWTDKPVLMILDNV